MFRNFTLFSLLGFLSVTSSADESVVFDNDRYSTSFSANENGKQLIELTKDGEDVDSWSSLISLQCHPNAVQLKEVIGPYYNARSKLVAMKPEVIVNTDQNTDSSILLLLGGPGATPNIEFVVARFFIAPQGGVYAAIYSHRLAADETVDVSRIMESKTSWNDQLVSITASTIESYCSETDA